MLPKGESMETIDRPNPSQLKKAEGGQEVQKKGEGSSKAFGTGAPARRAQKATGKQGKKSVGEKNQNKNEVGREPRSGKKGKGLQHPEVESFSYRGGGGGEFFWCGWIGERPH